MTMLLAKNFSVFFQEQQMLQKLKLHFENLNTSVDPAPLEKTLKTQVEQEGMKAVKALFLMIRESKGQVLETAIHMIYFVKYENLNTKKAYELSRFLHAYIDDPATSIESCRVAVFVLAKLIRLNKI